MSSTLLARLQRRRDLGLALALCALGQYELWGGVTYDGAPVWPGDSRLVNATLVLLITVPLVWRRIRPDIVCGLVFTVLVVSCAALGGGEATTEFLAFLVTAFTATAYSRWPTAQAGAALVAGTIHELRDPHVHGMGDAVWALGMLTVAWLLGWAVRTRQHRIGALESAADAARRRHAEEVARATAAERAAIARELHDIVAHAVAVIVIQAQAGRRALPHDPGLAADVFQTVEDSGRAALVELRRLLSLLSDDVTDSSLEPVASLRRLPDLIATFRSAGLQVDCTAPDALPPLSPTADLTAYRVVQQALTNTLHHAPGSSARVVLRCTGDELDIVADDDGAGRPHLAQPTASPGRGLIGMRERLALVGGVLVCAEPGERGFRVHARIPVEHPVEALTGTGS